MPERDRTSSPFSQPAHYGEAGTGVTFSEVTLGSVWNLQGDLENARYWYGQAGRAFPGREAVQEEITAARRAASDADVARTSGGGWQQ